MRLKTKNFLRSINRSVRVSVAIVVVGMANTAAADNFLTKWLPNFSAAPQAKPAQAKPQVVHGELIYVVCNSENVAVRGSDPTSTEFEAKPNEILKPFQGWGENKKVANINGVNETFIRAQFDSAGRSTGVGWIPEKFVKLKAQCPAANTSGSTAEELVSKSSSGSEHCCHFPIAHEPYMSYTTGERQFGALRDKGRVHAGSDLYGKQNEPILAVSSGKVIRGLYNFYFGTYAVDVKHPNFVVRYGEVSGKRAQKAVTGETLSPGETVAHMGQLVPRIRPPMLHFEMYRGNLNGTLSVPTNHRNKYGRRKDLIDPTHYLQHWESETF